MLKNGDLLVETVVTFHDELVNKTYTTLTSNHVCAKIDMAKKNTWSYENPMFVWKPNAPHLYDIEFRILDKETVLDEVGSYCAMREIRIDGSQILLNGKNLYQRRSAYRRYR